MATLVLSAVGAAVGASVGGGVLGLSSVVIGRAVGATLGRAVDQALLGSGSAAVETGRVDRLRLTGAGEGAAVAQVHGRVRIAGQVIWASRFLESARTSGGGKGMPRGPRVTEYSYTVSLAIGLCAGEIARVGRVWIDGVEASRDDLTLRVYTGSEDQLPDPKIEAVEGAGTVPAYRGLAYVVIEDLELGTYGNRVPQFSFEVIRPEPAGEGPGTDLSRLVRGVAMMPGTGEYALATTPVHYETEPGVATSANVHTPMGGTDFTASLEALEGELPLCRATSLVVSWFGDDLCCDRCRVRPRIEQAERDGVGMPWSVSGLNRAAAGLVPVQDGAVVYGGTPADASVVEAIGALRDAGQAVTFYPFVLMEQLAGNGLADPWSGAADQPVLPWRGRITLSVAPGRAGSPDRTAAAEAEVAAFFGAADPGDFVADAGAVAYTGPEDWGYRRFILHYAHLCAQAGGVEAFCIGSELRGLTQLRGVDGVSPAVDELRRLAADVRAILGPAVKIGYAADWSEYFGHQPQDGSGDVLYPLDALWADPEIGFVGIDNYMPLADWRDGDDHADAAAGSVYDLEYLMGNVQGGEGYDWYYPGHEARAAQRRVPITDGAQLIVERAAEQTLHPGAFAALAQDWRDEAVTFAATVRFPSVPGEAALFAHRGGGAGVWMGLRDEGNVFRLRAGDVGAAVSGSTDDTAVLELPVADLPADGAEHRLTWELRPAAPGRVRLWIDGVPAGEAQTTGGPLKGGLWSDGTGGAWGEGVAVAGEPSGAWSGFAGTLSVARGEVEETEPAEPWIYRFKDLRNWWSRTHHERIGGARLAQPTAWVPGSKPIWFTEYGCPAVDKGANQPNVFHDPKSSESALPFFSDGRRDDFMQLQYLRAVTEYWSDAANNPVSEVYGGPMVALDRAHVWAWDARPYPWFPGDPEVWSDADNWMRGHWITGRTGARALAAVVTEICAGSGVEAVDVSALHGVVRGYSVEEVTGARNALQPLMLAYGFDAVEREGRLIFRTRTGRETARLERGDLAVSSELEGDLEAIRMPEAEIAGRVRLEYVGADGDFAVEAAEAVFPATRPLPVSRSDMPLVLTRAEAVAIAERWLAEARVARDRVRLALPPSRLEVGAGDVVDLEGDRYRVDRVQQGGLQLLEAQRVEPGVYVPGDGSGGAVRVRAHPAALPLLDVFLDLPLLTGQEVPHAPHVAVTGRPWPGSAAVYDSATDSGYALNTLLGAAATVGVTETPLFAAPPGLLDRGAPLRVRLLGGALTSAPFEQVLAGANAMAIGSGQDDLWEVFQFADAGLVSAATYDLDRRLRGQAGTDAVMPEVWPAGSRVVLLDGHVPQIALAEANRGLARHYRIGPGSKGYDDPSYVERVRAFEGVGLRPYAPAHLRVSREAGGALTLRWIRRTRIGGDSWQGIEVPLGEESEQYLVRVTLDGAVRREATVSVPEWDYPAAAQAADGTDGPGVLQVAVAQLSSSYGAGPFATRTVAG